MYDELLATPRQRLLAHALLILMVSSFGFALLAQGAGAPRLERRYAEDEFEQPDPARHSAFELDHDALCLLRVHSPTVSQSWVDARVRIIGEQGAVGLDERVYLSYYFSALGPKPTSRGEDTKELFVRLPAGRWRVEVSGEAPPDRTKKLPISGGLRVGPDGQLIFDPPVFTYEPPSFDITGTRTLSHDEALEVTIKSDAVMSRYGVMLGLLCLALFGLYCGLRSHNVDKQRQQRALNIQLQTQRAIEQLLAAGVSPNLAKPLAPHAIPAAPTPDEPELLTPRHALAASLLIVALLGMMIVASVWGVHP